MSHPTTCLYTDEHDHSVCIREAKKQRFSGTTLFFTGAIAFFLGTVVQAVSTILL